MNLVFNFFENMWFWTYTIINENDKLGVTELYYESKYKRRPKKITWYSEFIITWISKIDLLEQLYKIVNWKIKLDNWYQKEDYLMMLNDVRKAKILDINNIKFYEKHNKYSKKYKFLDI